MQQFDTKENKGLIWHLMNESGIFNGIQNEYLDNVKRDFENKIVGIKMSIQPKDTLTLLNKRVLSEMMVDMGKYKNVYGNTNSSNTNGSVYTAKDVSSQRQKLLTDNFEKKKDEFTSLIGNKPPASIDFSDKLDQPIGSEIENMLAATIARRENELNIVLEKNEMSIPSASAVKWLNTDNVSTADRHIKIGQNTTLDDKSVIDIKVPQTSASASVAAQKQVRFTESQIIPDKQFDDDEIDKNPDIYRFLSIVSKDNNKDIVKDNDNDIIKYNNPSVIELLFQKISAIEESQREIIALLTKNRKD
jgi:hypothetical protein